MKHSLSIGKNNLTKSLYELILVDPYPAVILVVVFSENVKVSQNEENLSILADFYDQ